MRSAEYQSRPGSGRCSRISLSVPAIPAGFSFAALASGLGSPIRWRILLEISRGEGLLIVKLAERMGITGGDLQAHEGSARSRLGGYEPRWTELDPANKIGLGRGGNRGLPWKEK